MQHALWIAAPILIAIAAAVSRAVWSKVSGTSADNKKRAELRREVLTATDDLLKRMQ